MGLILILAYVATVPAANWMLGHIGTVCPPNGPCLIPVAPGLMAPSGVLMIGLALVLRDLVQWQYGRGVSVGCILAGAVLSFAVAPPALAVASALAFLVSELIDFSIYTPLARRRLLLAVAASSVAGSVVDSIVFLWAAFGSLEYLAGQVIGKTWMVLASLPVIAWLRRVPPGSGSARLPR